MSKAGVEPELVEAIARRVVELLRAEESSSQSGRLVDAATLARELGVERDWVYAHADELGAIRLGGPKGRLRFDRHEVGERLSAIGRPVRYPPRRSRVGDTEVVRRPGKLELRSLATAKSGRAARQRPRPDTGR
jgi:hypothetical protein